MNRRTWNTAVGFLRIGASSALGLFSLPAAIAALGHSDFGIFVTIAGIAGVMGVLRGALASGAVRNFACRSSSDQAGELAAIFRASIRIHALLGIVVFTGATVFGWYYIGHHLNAQLEREFAAFVILIAASISAAAMMITVPHTALLLAKDWASTVSFIELLQSALMFACAIIIGWFDGDRLIIYGIGIALTQIVASLLAVTECLRKGCIPTSATLGSSSAAHYSELLKFGFWNLFGALAAIGRTHGLSLVINAYSGPVATAGFGIANRLANLHQSITLAVRRPLTSEIIRQESLGERERMLALSSISTRFSFIVAAAWVVPLCILQDELLGIWIKDLPIGTSAMVTVVLASLTIDLLSGGYVSGIQAIGRVAGYQSVVGLLSLLPVPLSIVLFEWGYGVAACLTSLLLGSVIVCFVRMLFVRRLAGLPVRAWLLRDFSRCSASVVVSGSAAYCLRGLDGLDVKWKSAFMVIFGAIIALRLCLSESERLRGVEAFRKILPRIRKISA